MYTPKSRVMNKEHYSQLQIEALRARLHYMVDEAHLNRLHSVLYRLGVNGFFYNLSMMY